MDGIYNPDKDYPFNVASWDEHKIGTTMNVVKHGATDVSKPLTRSIPKTF
jgi:hypothetical protein